MEAVEEALQRPVLPAASHPFMPGSGKEGVLSALHGPPAVAPPPTPLSGSRQRIRQSKKTEGHNVLHSHDIKTEEEQGSSHHRQCYPQPPSKPNEWCSHDRKGQLEGDSFLFFLQVKSAAKPPVYTGCEITLLATLWNHPALPEGQLIFRLPSHNGTAL